MLAVMSSLASSPVHPRPDPERFRCCLLYGAIGDALGAPVEFAPFEEIADRFGTQGIQRIVEPGYFTDDTQMTLFTAEGLIRTSVRERLRGISGGLPAVMYHAYLRWLFTQGVSWPPKGNIISGPITSLTPDGWLAHDRRLHHRMAPANTCISSLASGIMGTVERRINQSKGCGAVMRVAPMGLGLWRHDPSTIYDLTCSVAAITHGHDDGIHPAGALAVMIAALLRDQELGEAAETALAFVPSHLSRRLTSAIYNAKWQLSPSEMRSKLGLGFTGDEALAIALYCAFAYPDFSSSIHAAVNHDGNSASTGAICGNILGAALATRSPDLGDLDLGDLFASDLVETVAADLYLEFTQHPSEEGIEHESAPLWWWNRYPGW